MTRYWFETWPLAFTDFEEDLLIVDASMYGFGWRVYKGTSSVPVTEGVAEYRWTARLRAKSAIRKAGRGYDFTAEGRRRESYTPRWYFFGA